MNAPEQHRAFTLVELLVVIAIITVLAGLLMPALIIARRRGQEANTRSRIQQCQMAAEQFFTDHGDYPPTRWDEVDEFFDYDADPNTAGRQDIDFDSWTEDPRDYNQGIEVFTACLATNLGGGPYLQPDGNWLGNTDDPDPRPRNGEWDETGDIADATQWYFGSEDLFEVVDYWGNPLVYFHNRDYQVLDGAVDSDFVAPGGDEDMLYVDKEGQVRSCYARSRVGMKTENYPNLDSFQLYSWGADGWPGRAYDDTGEDDNFQYAGWTGAKSTDSSVPLEGSGYDWIPGDGNLTNWEE